jgi:hypothetical protein
MALNEEMGHGIDKKIMKSVRIGKEMEMKN